MWGTPHSSRSTRTSRRSPATSSSPSIVASACFASPLSDVGCVSAGAVASVSRAARRRNRLIVDPSGSAKYLDSGHDLPRVPLRVLGGVKDEAGDRGYCGAADLTRLLERCGIGGPKLFDGGVDG